MTETQLPILHPDIVEIVKAREAVLRAGNVLYLMEMQRLTIPPTRGPSKQAGTTGGRH